MNRTFVTYILILMSSMQTFSQKNADLGLLAGGAYYLGDMNTGTQYKNLNIGGGAFYKFNYNARYSLKASFIYSKLSGDDNTSNYGYQTQRGSSFATNIYELTAQGEFNFLPYSIGDDKTPYTTYTFFGLSGLYASNASKPLQIALPMGVGFKFNISKKLAAGIELGFRKTFTDQLDNLAGVKDDAFNNIETKQLSYFHDKDWYSLTAAFITYKIYSSGGKCRAYDY